MSKKTTLLDISSLDSVTFARSSRAKYKRITVHPDKRITVTVPKWGSIREAREFLASKVPWIQKQYRKIEQYREQQERADVNIDIDQAQEDLFDRLRYFSEEYNLPFNRAAFRCQRTKWGSCSGKKNINLNVNIAFLPKHLQDYILLHELVHTRVLNHSQQFWSELNQYTDGRAKEMSKELKKYDMKLRF